MRASTDQQLIDIILAGDTKVFSILVERYQEFVYTIILRIVKVEAEAEEVAQDTFVKAYESLDTYRGDSKFSTWIYSIAYRKALDRLRKIKRHNTTILEAHTMETHAISIDNGLKQLVQKERSIKIKQCIAQLSELEATLIMLYYYEEQSVKEMASVVNISEENVKVKLYRSRKKLYNLLQQAIVIQKTH